MNPSCLAFDVVLETAVRAGGWTNCVLAWFFVSFRDGRSHPSDVNEGYDHYICQRMKAGTRRLGARARDHMNFETACGLESTD